MSDYNSLKAAINANIRKNGRQEITGQVLNGILRAMVDALGAGFTFRAVASPDTDPGSTDSRVFYIATIPGTYGHMGGIEIEEGEVAILKFYDDEWHKEPTGLASQAALESLGDALGAAIGEKMTFCELWCDGDKITRKNDQTALTFSEVKDLMDDPSQFVALKYIDVFWMLPQYDDEGGAIIFTGVSLMSAQGDLWRVAINEENQISDYSIAIENQYLKTNDLGDEQRDNFKTYPTTQAVNTALNDKVDKVPGKGLSSNDFTTQEKNKLAGLNNYDDTELRSQIQSGVTAASGSAAQAAASAASAESKYAGILQAMENLPDGSAVSAQVALNTQKVTELEGKVGSFDEADKGSIAANIFGEEHEQEDWIIIEPYWHSDTKYSNTNAAVVGNDGTGWVTGTGAKTPASYEGNALYKYHIENGKRYEIYGYAKDKYTNWLIIDSENIIREKLIGNFRETPYTFMPDYDGYLIINFGSYVETDGVKLLQTTPIKIKGLLERVDHLEHVEKPFNGKRFVCFGDSLTQFSGTDGKRWSDHFADITGAEVINVGISGSRLSQNRQDSSIITDPSATGYTNTMNIYSALSIVNMVRASCGMRFDSSYTYMQLAQQFVQATNDDAKIEAVNRLASLDMSAVDAVIVMGGSNDYQGGATYGTSGDTLPNHTLGAINLIVSSLLSTYKHLSVFFVTPCVCYKTDVRQISDFSDNYAINGKTLKELVDDMMVEYKYNHMPVCDLYNTLGWNEYNFSEYFTHASDGTHPYGGFKQIAQKIASFIIANKNF